MNNENIVVKLKFGSHLYGTATEDSDMDIKGIFLPTKEQIFLGKIPKSYSNSKKKAEGEKNTADDVDTEIYSLHYFIKLACEGQTVALDMLHAPANMILEASDIWYKIVANREKFYTKNLKAFVGYARKQAAKYGVKGDRLNVVDRVVLDIFDAQSDYIMVQDEIKGTPQMKLKSIWHKLPVTDYSDYIENSPQGIKQYHICGKILQETMTIKYGREILQRYIDVYGKRARLAAENRGIDWKSVSHALRAAYQVKELLTENTITFPLREALFLREVKQGKLDYLTEVAPKLEALMDEVEILSENSTLPKKPDGKFWDQFIIGVIERNI